MILRIPSASLVAALLLFVAALRTFAEPLAQSYARLFSISTSQP